MLFICNGFAECLGVGLFIKIDGNELSFLLSFIVVNVSVIVDTVFVVVEYLMPMTTHINSYMDFFKFISHDDKMTTLQLDSVNDYNYYPYFLLSNHRDFCHSFVAVVGNYSFHEVKYRSCIFYFLRLLCFDTFCGHKYPVE